jgi:hypothetical protein
VGNEEVVAPGFVHHLLRFINTTCTVFDRCRDIRVTDLRDPELFRTKEITQLTEYLVEGRHSAYPGPSGKFIDRIPANPHRKLKTSFDAETFLREDEDYFLRNTNCW